MHVRTDAPEGRRRTLRYRHVAHAERSDEVEVVGLKSGERVGNLNSFTLMHGNEKLGRWSGLRASHRVANSGSEPPAFGSCLTCSISLIFFANGCLTHDPSSPAMRGPLLQLTRVRVVVFLL